MLAITKANISKNRDSELGENIGFLLLERPEQGPDEEGLSMTCRRGISRLFIYRCKWNYL
jgi:hypothetical protein